MNNESLNLFPNKFLYWSPSCEGLVKKPFLDGDSSRLTPVFPTNISRRLDEWVDKIINKDECPRCIFLVGGTGNGKSEAVEQLIFNLSEKIENGKKIKQSLQDEFEKSIKAGFINRKVTVNHSIGKFKSLHLVQDASGVEKNKSPQKCFIEDLKEIVLGSSDEIYICCINRGIIAESLSELDDEKDKNIIKFIRTLMISIKIDPSSPDSWPLSDYSDIGIWPMDAESLMDKDIYNNDKTPMHYILDYITDKNNWEKECLGGELNPFHQNREILSKKNAKIH